MHVSGGIVSEEQHDERAAHCEGTAPWKDCQGQPCELGWEVEGGSSVQGSNAVSETSFSATAAGKAEGKAATRHNAACATPFAMAYCLYAPRCAVTLRIGHTLSQQQAAAWAPVRALGAAAEKNDAMSLFPGELPSPRAPLDSGPSPGYQPVSQPGTGHTLGTSVGEQQQWR